VSVEHSCDNCGSPTSNEPMCLCDACNDAEAVADVVAWLMSDADSYANLNTTKPERLPPVVTALRLAAEQIKDGAHVGAAKKGGE